MPSCSHCGADVILARDLKTGAMVPLDPAVDASSDAPRYRIEEGAVTGSTCVQVTDGAVGSFYPDHRFDCFGYQSGRGARLR